MDLSDILMTRGFTMKQFSLIAKILVCLAILIPLFGFLLYCAGSLIFSAWVSITTFVTMVVNGLFCLFSYTVTCVGIAMSLAVIAGLLSLIFETRQVTQGLETFEASMSRFYV